VSVNAFALSGLLTGISSLAMGLFVLSRDRTSPLYRVWFLFTTSVAIWGFGGMWIALEENADIALWAWRVAFAFGVLWIPPLFYHFVTIFCDIKETRLVFLNYAVGILLFPVILFTDWGFGSVRYLFSSFYYAVPGSPIFHLFVAWWVWLIIYAHYKVFNAYRDASGLRRNQFKYAFIAFAVGYCTGALDYLPFYGVELYPYGNFGIILYPIIMAYAIARYRLMDITVVIHKGLTYALLLGAVLGPVFLAAAISKRATFYAVPPLLAASVVFCCGLWIALKNPRNTVNHPFALLCAGICAWLFSMFMMYSAHQEAEAFKNFRKLPNQHRVPDSNSNRLPHQRSLRARMGYLSQSRPDSPALPWIPRDGEWILAAATVPRL